MCDVPCLLLHFCHEHQHSQTLQTGTFSICLPFSGCLKFPFGVKVSCHIVVEVKTPKWFYSAPCFVLFLVAQCRWQKYFAIFLQIAKCHFLQRQCFLCYCHWINVYLLMTKVRTRFCAFVISWSFYELIKNWTIIFSII